MIRSLVNIGRVNIAVGQTKIVMTVCSSPSDPDECVQ